MITSFRLYENNFDVWMFIEDGETYEINDSSYIKKHFFFRYGELGYTKTIIHSTGNMITRMDSDQFEIYPNGRITFSKRYSEYEKPISYVWGILLDGHDLQEVVFKRYYDKIQKWGKENPEEYNILLKKQKINKSKNNFNL